MKNFKLTVLTLAGTIMGLTSLSSYAVMSVPYGWYVEGNVGASNSSNSYGNGVSSGNSGVAWGLNLGYKFLPMMAIEAGGTSYTTTNLKNSANGSQFGTDKHYGYDLAIKGMIPIAATGMEVFGKLGGSQLYAKSHISNASNVPAGFKTRATSHLSPFYGVGAAYYFAQGWGVNVQAMRANGNSSTGRQTMYSAGLTWIIY